ncbi:hypothetical protein GCM10020000_12750 [Streptomyces olivoverticillatus]
MPRDVFGMRRVQYGLERGVEVGRRQHIERDLVQGERPAARGVPAVRASSEKGYRAASMPSLSCSSAASTASRNVERGWKADRMTTVFMKLPTTSRILLLSRVVVGTPMAKSGCRVWRCNTLWKRPSSTAYGVTSSAAANCRTASVASGATVTRRVSPANAWVAGRVWSVGRAAGVEPRLTPLQYCFMAAPRPDSSSRRSLSTWSP